MSGLGFDRKVEVPVALYNHVMVLLSDLAHRERLDLGQTLDDTETAIRRMTELDSGTYAR